MLRCTAVFANETMHAVTRFVIPRIITDRPMIHLYAILSVTEIIWLTFEPVGVGHAILNRSARRTGSFVVEYPVERNSVSSTMSRCPHENTPWVATFFDEIFCKYTHAQLTSDQGNLPRGRIAAVF